MRPEQQATCRAAAVRVASSARNFSPREFARARRSGARVTFNPGLGDGADGMAWPLH
jgi:hypothetical protein